MPIQEARKHLKQLSAEERIDWAYKKFGSKFVATTSFGIQSAVLLHMIHKIQNNHKIPVIWVDTGYLPSETYKYAKHLTEKLSLNIQVVQSSISPARMEALYGRLWETEKPEDLEKYHLIRKVEPLDLILEKLNVSCWSSGVRGNQTNYRRSMTCLDFVRDRLSIRPLLDWNQKDIFYYMQNNNLPQHPLFEKGYSTVGDWHSSAADSNGLQGRDTRFGGLKEECGIHLQGEMGEGI